jgi:hypothetical protein
VSRWVNGWKRRSNDMGGKSGGGEWRAGRKVVFGPHVNRRRSTVLSKHGTA